MCETEDADNGAGAEIEKEAVKKDCATDLANVDRRGTCRIV